MNIREAKKIVEEMEVRHPELANSGNTLLIPILDVREYCISKYFLEGYEAGVREAAEKIKQRTGLIHINVIGYERLLEEILKLLDEVKK